MPERGVLVKACLNGGRRRADHAATPVTPRELAADARAAIAAGAAALHVHPRAGDERETLDPAACAAAVAAIRGDCPGIPVGLSTAAWIASGPRARLAHIEAWTVLPEFASVNFSEPGTADVCAVLLRRGVGIEAGLWSMEDARAFIASGLAGRCLRVLVETQPADPEEAVAAAAAIDAALDAAGIGLPRVHHGEGPATWAVLAAALDRGRDIRVGLEDTVTLPDGRRAPDNAALVAEAVRMVRRHGREPA
ncbi:MAG TPA: 3-keto-5-aminohexanoate cleavage protein [bacterium]|nr:3-keto-5-aminohexanoate cleavage protein [bacterium]